MKAADLMTREVVTVSPERPLADAIHLMLGHRISGLPVVDASGRLVGLLTTGDLLRRSETGTDAPGEGWLQSLLTRGWMAERYVHTHGRWVQDVMTRDVATVGEASPLDDVVRIMAARHVRRVLVVDGERLVGIVSRSDLVRALGVVLDQVVAPDQDDGAICDRILAEMARHRWAPGRGVEVSVKEGVVELRGEIHDERLRGALRVIAEAIPGVKAVRDILVLAEEPGSVLIYGA